MGSCPLLLLLILQAVATISALPTSTFSTKELAMRYAELHPNTEGAIEECQVYPLEGRGTDHGDDPLNAVVDPNLLWPFNTIYYQIAEAQYTPEQVAKIEEWIGNLVEMTSIDGKECVSIVKRAQETDWVLVENYSGCSSYIGRQGGVQRISLVDSCVEKNGTIMHEFLHAFGFYHEQSRTDRDDWVIINWDNIQPGYYGNFAKLDATEIDLLGTAYDYGSVLHYSAYAFAIDEAIPTIITLVEGAEIGQRVTMSALDIERVQILYKCLAPADSVYFKHLAKGGNTGPQQQAQ